MVSAAERLAFCLQALAREYGAKKLAAPQKRPPALDELVLTILSQNTNDTNRDRAWNNLRRLFPRWEDAAQAPPAALAEAIRVGGLAAQKAKAIQAALQRIRLEQGSYSLDRLNQMPREEARDYLLSFAGVGEKTAACVLLFACGRPVFPVDTHIFRVSRRVGLLPEKISPAQAHQRLDALVPDGKKYELHLNLIAHGRAVCRARKPDCPRCCLRKHCRYYRQRKATP